MSLTPTSSPEHFGRKNRIETIRGATVDGINGLFDIGDLIAETGGTIANRSVGIAHKFGNALFGRNH